MPGERKNPNTVSWIGMVWGAGTIAAVVAGVWYFYASGSNTAPTTETAALQAPANPNWNEIALSDDTFREYQAGYRTDTIDIPLPADGGELEYKLAIKAGDTIVYTWTVADLADPELLYSEFHGHTERVGTARGDLMFYRKATGATESGMLVAPFTGIHGWYLKNDAEQPIVVRLNVAGFYELIPDQIKN